MTSQIRSYLKSTVNPAPLAVFRIGFGLMMCFSIIRFWSYGWIEKLYIDPKFHFSYFGFEWIKPLETYTYFIFAICGLSALLVALGLKYRLSIILFFLSFTYIELMDKTTYLNHYYFISLMSFLLCFLPANAYYSVDNLIRRKSYQSIPKWSIDSIKLMLSIVYIYAGLAKINSDWLFKAMPLKLWLPSKYDLPIIGESLMQEHWFHVAMSWSGMLYDLSIPFLLFYRRTRIFAFVLVVFFHVFTRVLFPIGMFPYIMIVSTLIFFDAYAHERIIKVIKYVVQRLGFKSLKLEAISWVNKKPNFVPVLLTVFFTIQLFLPFRYLTYPDELFWTEEGYRYSWRVMLIEKTGYAEFKVVDAKKNTSFLVKNSDFLTPFQEKEMTTQPDFILEYAHFLGQHFKSQGHDNLEIYVDSYVALNGRRSQRFVNPKIDLLKINDSFEHKEWILPFNDEIKGL
ncbi:MAG: HTTM domain-containing protein [Winogradskyella sp.]|uniref:HTTM domain-containing protein n=1 Tax=Winogradskyella sp. TaxID=1883156 RepID=UPI0025DD658D|nr:HTTM domain-containing protein [Winogradskyella sp.]NRB84716.1 HTTM domain-containing protein [Winogradskyella sp.]